MSNPTKNKRQKIKEILKRTTNATRYIPKLSSELNDNWLDDRAMEREERRKRVRKPNWDDE